MIPQGEGVRVCGVAHRWFTDAPGPVLAEQSRRQTRPDPPTREDELEESVEMRQVNAEIRSEQRQGQVAPVFKINTLRMLTTGKAKEGFDTRDVDRDHTGSAKSYEELLTRPKEIVGQHCQGENAARGRPRGRWSSWRLELAG
jgi:hypothetical protein